MTLSDAPRSDGAPLIAASYERVSTRIQGVAGFSLGAQEKDAAEFARQHGWILPRGLRFRDGEDRAASGADWDLEGLNAAMDAAKRREYQILIVPDPDRFARSMVKALVFEEQLRNYGVRVVYIRMPLEDTAEGRLQKNVMFSFAEYEREKIKFRTARGRREKAEKGIVVGAGPVPYGYRYVRAGERNRVVGLEPHPTTAPIVAQIYGEALRCSGVDIAARLRQGGVPSPRAPWSSASVFRILTNPVYSGRFVYGARGRTRVEALASGAENLMTVRVVPIVDVGIWDAVQQALVRRRSQRRGRCHPTNDQFILRGLLTCGHCGGGLSTFWNTSHKGGKRIRYYKCIRNEPHKAATLGKPLCAMRDVLATPLEQLVWDSVATTLLDPHQLRAGLESARARHEEAAAGRADRLQVIDREIDRQRKRLERIVDEMLDTDKGSETHLALAQRRRATEELLNRLQAEHAEQVAEPAEGLSEDQALQLERFAAEVGAGIETASQTDRRWVYEHLQLRGRIRLEPNGIKLGQRHSFDLEFDAVVPIANSASNLHNKLVAYPMAADFLRRHLLGETPN